MYIKHHYTNSCIKRKYSYPYPSKRGWNSPSSPKYTYCINTLCDVSGLTPNLSVPGIHKMQSSPGHAYS